MKTSFYFFICGLVVVVSINNTYAKRGCSAFGHSCYGGHGKRSQIVNDDRSQENNPSLLKNKLTFIDTDGTYYGQRKRDFPASRTLDDERLEPYAVSILIGKWLASQPRSHRLDTYGA